ncbi:multiple sugar transport system permease protein [Sporomusaceae bacterium BoRhaA]|uniref:carbohydrate ABC transporter permease n=1 Tax=Pelorhabdus rhamnosifermentans TaxID=2772457 RepID=UPI001C062CF9|nr:carbohydrate ABC transporter permease [Pelorhabdus rhamnosifermentans]MBU2699999.1 multiple sugar transport system permease protein [Pelorhabdus rhamnosifermentans]
MSNLNFKRMAVISNLLRYITLGMASLIIAFPFFWLLSNSIKTTDEIWLFPPTWWPALAHWENYPDVLAAAPLGLYIFNSVFTAGAIVILQLIGSGLMAYAFSFLKFKGNKILFAVVMATYMLPAAITYVPSYILLSKLHLLDTYLGIIISNAVSVFGIFLIRQDFKQVNKALIEAAHIDGAGHCRILLQILVPLCKPSFITLGLISFIANYNNYLWPSLIVKDPQHYLIAAGLRQFYIQGGAYGIKWPQIMAASAMAVIPLLILFLFAQKWLVRSIGDTGVKG